AAATTMMTPFIRLRSLSKSNGTRSFSSTRRIATQKRRACPPSVQIRASCPAPGAGCGRFPATRIPRYFTRYGKSMSMRPGGLAGRAALEKKRYRTIVYQGDLHVGAETAVSDGYAMALHLLGVELDQTLGHVGRG